MKIKRQASAVNVKGPSSRHWEKSPGVYENHHHVLTVTVKGYSSRCWEKVLEFMKIKARRRLSLSRDIALDLEKKSWSL